MVRRKQELAEETRQAILLAARHHFQVSGYAQSNVAAIALEAGVTKGGLFHHFSTKEDLFRAVWTELQIEMDAEARVAAIAARSKTDPYAAFLAGCRKFLEWSARPDFQRIVLIDGPAVLGVDRWHELDSKLGESNVSAGVAWLIKQGILKETDVKPMAVLLQSALNGAGFALSRNAPGVTMDTVYASFERLLRNLR